MSCFAKTDGAIFNVNDQRQQALDIKMISEPRTRFVLRKATSELFIKPNQPNI